MKMLRTTFLLAFTTCAHGFAFLNAFQQQTANPSLASLAKAPTGTLLDVRLDVGNDDYSRLNLQGLHLELLEEVSRNNNRPSLPGSDGPRAGVSTGAKSVKVKNDAFFVGMTGQRNVPLRHGCWEMVWRDNAPAGVIVCGFELQETVQRNNASLEKGRIYLSFPVWSKEGLEQQQERRRKVEARAKFHQDAKKEAFENMEKTANPIMKALYFRNAAEATEKLSYIPTDSVAQIPMDKDVMALDDSLLITIEGTVWRKDGEGVFGNDQHTLLGTATIRPGTGLQDTL